MSSINPSKEYKKTEDLGVQSMPDIENKYVHCIYDAIAPHFSSTRFAKWPKVASFLNSLTPGSIVLAAGCGNGKYLGFSPECSYVGCDISPSLIDICVMRGHETVVADMVNLPYRSGFGDAAISIAVLHHLISESRRRKAIKEHLRVVRIGGVVLITFSAVEHEDRLLLEKWTPLCHKFNEKWTRPNSPRVHSLSAVVLESILETDECGCLDAKQSTQAHNIGVVERSNKKVSVTTATSSRDGKTETNQEYFVPWHLPYHRAEIGGASVSVLANGLAKKGDKKGAIYGLQSLLSCFYQRRA